MSFIEGVLLQLQNQLEIPSPTVGSLEMLILFKDFEFFMDLQLLKFDTFPWNNFKNKKKIFNNLPEIANQKLRWYCSPTRCLGICWEHLPGANGLLKQYFVSDFTFVQFLFDKIPWTAECQSKQPPNMGCFSSGVWMSSTDSTVFPKWKIKKN